MRAISTRRRSPPESTPIGEVLPRGVEAETGGDRPRLALGGVAAVRPEQLLGPAVAGDGALVGVLLHGDAQLLDALDLGVDAAPGQHVGDGGAGVGGGVDPRVLGQVAETALADHPSGGRLGVTAEHPEQARLAGAVAADEADLVLGHDREVGPLDDEAAADRHGETLGLQHGVKPRGRGAGSNQGLRLAIAGCGSACVPTRGHVWADCCRDRGT